MFIWQQATIFLYAIFNAGVFIKGFKECSVKKNAMVLTPKLGWIGVFAWGDAVIFGIFWAIISLVSLLFNDWLLFLLTVSVFWVIRSLGETIYWFNQQFSTVNRNPPHKLFGFQYFHNDSIWYIYQITWQCVTVVSIITSLYLAKLWLALA